MEYQIEQAAQDKSVKNRKTKMKILFVAEQFAPPVYDGSTTVYHSWLKALKSVGDVYAILFTLQGAPTEETHSFLRQTCRDYLIAQGRGPSPVLKTARALGRFVNGSLFAHPLIEEFGRGPIKAETSRFIAAHKPDLAIVSKLECIHLLGLDVLSKLRIPKIMDLHDDFVTREKLGRQLLRDMLAEFPSLTTERHFQLRRIRDRLSRFDFARAQRQEARLLGLFDRIMISSYEEYQAYSARDEVGDRCAHVPWPIEISVNPLERNGAPEYDAGLIAASNEFNLEGLIFLIREALPLIRKRRPDFRLLIVGNITSSYLAAGLPMEGVSLVGVVDDLSKFYSRVKMCLVPLLNGTGVSLKTMEALSYGLPVVATPKGARGLGGQKPPNLHLADTAQAFAETTLSILENWPNASGNAPVNRSNGSLGDSLTRFVQLCNKFDLRS
jgi:glycosyltransferase involved in cell wall biosynthesis